MYMNPVSSNIDLLQYWRTSLDGASQPVFSDIANRIASVILSPDGKQFSYMRTDCPSKEGYIVSCPSVFLSDLHNLTTSEIPLPGLLGIYERSPDGAWLLLNSQEGKRSAMYLWSPVSGAKERLPDELQNQSNSGLPKWSPDGKYLLFENMSWAAPRILDIKKQQVMEALVRLKAKELNWYYTWDATWLPMNN
jgi:Tol biopolymer transport system component